MIEKKKDDSTLLGCGGIVLASIILMIIAIILTLVLKGKQGANEMFNNEDDDIIGQLRMGLIVLVIIGVLYLVRKGNKK